MDDCYNSIWLMDLFKDGKKYTGNVFFCTK